VGVGDEGSGGRDEDVVPGEVSRPAIVSRAERRGVSRVVHSLGKLRIVHVLELPSQVHGLAVEARAKGLPRVHPANDEVQHRTVSLLH
jgi:hypothetical protein